MVAPPWRGEGSGRAGEMNGPPHAPEAPMAAGGGVLHGFAAPLAHILCEAHTQQPAPAWSQPIHCSQRHAHLPEFITFTATGTDWVKGGIGDTVPFNPSLPLASVAPLAASAGVVALLLLLLLASGCSQPR